MAQNIDLLGAQYSDVPAVELPKVGGGTASFTAVTDTTAAAADVAQGKYFYTSAGVRTEGTSTGGGGTTAGTVTQDQDGYLVLDDDPPTHITVESLSVTQNGTYTAPTGTAYSPVTVNVSGGGGLVYETGSWTPANDISSYEIAFSNQHATAPFMYLVADATNTYSAATNSSYSVAFVDWFAAFNASFNVSESTYRNGRVLYDYRPTATTSLSYNGTSLSDSTSQSEIASTLYWANTTRIKAYAGNASRYWRAGRTYKWIAVWAPTS